jgi:HK97 family phage major capsid protein
MSNYDNEITSSQLSNAMKHPAIIAEIFQQTVNNSVIMQMGRRLPNMATGTARMSVLDLLPVAYFQATGTTLKKTTKQQWKGKDLVAEEVAVIVPISENVLADATNVDIWGEIIPRVSEAMGLVVDTAVLTGTGLPATWLTDTGGVSRSLAAWCVNNSMTVTSGTGDDLYDDIFGTDGVIALVEAQGFDVNGHVAPVSSKGRFRHVRENRSEATGGGQPLLWAEGDNYRFGMSPIAWVKNNALAATTSQLISGDWSQLLYAMRQDISIKLLDQAVITDGEGAVVFNLAQQDMVALRFTMRMAVQVANPVTQLSATEAARFPFASLIPAAS